MWPRSSAGDWLSTTGAPLKTPPLLPNAPLLPMLPMLLLVARLLLELRRGSSTRGSGQTLPGTCSRATQHRLLQKNATEEKKDAAATTAFSTDIEVAPRRPIR